MPGAFQGSVVGSIIVAAYFTVAYTVGGEGFAASDLVGVVMMFCFVTMVGTMAGMIVSAIYILLIGLPMALLMRRRIGSRAMLVATILVAILVGLLVSWLLMTPIWGVQEDRWLLAAVALCYTIPAGIAYRRAIITERMRGFWSAKGP